MMDHLPCDRLQNMLFLDSVSYFLLIIYHSLRFMCLDPYILNTFYYLDPISINVSQCMTSLLKLEITVSFLTFVASSFRVTEED